MKNFPFFYKLLFTALTVFLILSHAEVCRAFSAKVVKISDGDTLTVAPSNGPQIKIRLYGIDCPESSQVYGKSAARFAAGEVLHKTVNVQKIETDQYGRMVAIITLKNAALSLNESLVKNGYAWYYPNYCKTGAFCRKLKQFEKEASGQKLGLWQDENPMPPWDYRKAPPQNNFMRQFKSLLAEIKQIINAAKGLLREIKILISN